MPCHLSLSITGQSLLTIMCWLTGLVFRRIFVTRIRHGREEQMNTSTGTSDGIYPRKPGSTILTRKNSMAWFTRLLKGQGKSSALRHPRKSSRSYARANKTLTIALPTRTRGSILGSSSRSSAWTIGNSDSFVTCFTSKALMGRLPRSSWSFLFSACRFIASLQSLNRSQFRVSGVPLSDYGNWCLIGPSIFARLQTA